MKNIVNGARSWKIRDLLGWCKVKLDQRCRADLESDASGVGLRTEYMLVEGDGLRSNKPLTVEAVLRMIPDKVLILK